jgi:hypothetical protein
MATNKTTKFPTFEEFQSRKFSAVLGYWRGDWKGKGTPVGEKVDGTHYLFRQRVKVNPVDVVENYDVFDNEEYYEFKDHLDNAKEAGDNELVRELKEAWLKSHCKYPECFYEFTEIATQIDPTTKRGTKWTPISKRRRFGDEKFPTKARAFVEDMVKACQ